jgi:hypothetical protein
VDVHLDGSALQPGENTQPDGGYCLKHAEQGQSSVKNLSHKRADNSVVFSKKSEIALLQVVISFFRPYFSSLLNVTSLGNSLLEICRKCVMAGSARTILREIRIIFWLAGDSMRLPLDSTRKLTTSSHFLRASLQRH